MEGEHVQDTLPGRPQVILEIEGILEAIDFLADLARLVSSEEVWIPTTAAAGEELRRYAMSISPVITGAYRSAHRVYPGPMRSVLTPDPSVRNPVSGVPVVRYAGFVEDRHQVYERTFAVAGERAAVMGVDTLLRGMG